MENTATENLSKANGTASEFKKKIQGFENHLERISHNAGEKMGGMASNLSDSVSNYLKTSKTYVRENPVKGVAIAAAAGILVGGLMSLGMRRRS